MSSLFLNLSLKEVKFQLNMHQPSPDSSALKWLEEKKEERIFNQNSWQLIRNYQLIHLELSPIVVNDEKKGFKDHLGPMLDNFLRIFVIT